MNSPTSQFITSRRMGIYDEFNQISMWADFKSNGFLNPPASMIMEDNNHLDNQSEDTSQGTPSNKYDHEETRRADKVLRRLAQNREAARKSRLRKKAYVQQLESSRLKLVQMEQELERARQQGLYVGGGLDTSNLGYPGTVNPVIVTFEMEYGHWVEEQNKQICELKTALSSSSHLLEIELRILVDSVMNHYSDLFRMKAKAAKADIFYLITGLWKTSAERFFLWIGGFRPSEILKVLLPQLDPLTDEQLLNIYHLRQSCQQAEDALSQGMEKLQLNVAETVVANHMGEGSYLPQVGKAMEKLEALACFVNQADHLRQETLQQMSRILTVPQAARGLLALGEYCQRLRALSSLWATRLREPA